MKCELHYVKKSDLGQIKKDLDERQPGLFYTEIEGINIQSFTEFMSAIDNAFKFPRPAVNINAYFDWMRDLMWLTDATGFVLIINQFSLMLLKDLPMKVSFINDFPETIFPWWDDEVEKCRVGGEKKPFLVYLVEEPLEDLAKGLSIINNDLVANVEE